MKILMNSYLAASLSFLLTAMCHAGEPESLRLPEPLSGLVSKVIEIKTEAMKLPGMRSEDGKLGRQVEGIMDQIAELASEEIAKQAQLTQDHDIRAKIILWAQDRKKRPAEYERFAKFYMNRPASRKDAIEYFYRPWKNAGHPFSDTPPTPESFVPRPGTWTPHPIDKEDVIEANRHVMEYCFFMPPTGRAFNFDSSRSNISEAILSLMNHDKYHLIFEKDLEIWFENWKSNPSLNNDSDDRDSHGFTNQEALRAIRSLPNHSSFKQLSNYASVAPIKELIRTDFQRYWELAAISSDRAEQIASNYQTWIGLAKQNWPKPEEREFALLLLSIPLPQQATKPKR